MKKTFITLLAALLLPLVAEAQYKLIVRYSDGTTFEKNVWDVDSVYFEDIEARALPTGAPAPTAVNLGLSVDWANINLGATSPTDDGWLVGWGDVTGQNESMNLKWYPVLQPSSDIVGFGNDIVKKYWGASGVWRLPTDEELQELIINCSWTWDAENNGFEVSGNGNSIFLPAAGIREGSAVSGQNVVLNYWSGTLNKADNTTAKAMTYNGNGDKPTVGVLKRYFGCALRAVYGEPKVNVSVSSGDAYNLGVASATIKVQLAGSYANYNGLRCGLVYGTSQDLQNDNSRLETPTQSCSGGSCEITLSGLTPDVPYWYCAFVEVNGQRIYQQEDAKNFKTTLFPEPEIVDLGLSVKWASFNVGATSSTERGLYIGWGDPTGLHTSHSYDDYGYSTTSMNIGFNPDYDTPYATWQKKWRMPTRSEFEELYEKTTVTYETVGSVGCYKFTGKNGNSIYLPVTGLYTAYSSSSTDYRQTQYGWYWTAECSASKEPYLVSLYSTSSPDIQTSVMWYRMPIRAVYEEATGYHEGGGSGEGGEGGSGEGGSEEPYVEPTPETPVAGTAVDLGLSVKWADRNIGGTSQDLVGDYLTWGATEMQDQYTVASYIYGNSSDIGGMKYLGTYTDPKDQARNSYSIAGTQYDAAHVRWGGTWRMPTRAEINELRESCTWTWSSRADDKHGVVWGYEVSRNGKSIFLPAGGRMTQTDEYPQVFKLDEVGYYWSDYVYYGVATEHYNQNAYILQFKETENKVTYMERNIGLSIRPVQSK